MEGYANGKVCVGFSHPVVAKYAAAGGAVSFSEAMVLARGVGVDVSVNTASDNEFYADNVLAESENDVFESGSLKLTVDGLFAAARRFICGQEEAQEESFGQVKVKVTKHSARAEAPYIAVGFVVKYRSKGKDIFQPYIFPKTKFKTQGLKAETKGKTTNYQTEELEAVIHRDDTDKEAWKWEIDEFNTEAEAKAALQAVLGLAEA